MSIADPAPHGPHAAPGARAGRDPGTAVRLFDRLAARLPGTLAARLRQAGHLAGVMRGAASVLAIRVAGAGITYLTMAALARWMGAFEFGIYAYVWTWVMLIGTMAPLGLNTAMLRFVPEYRTRRRWGRLRGLLVQAHLMAALAAGLISLVLGVLLVAVTPWLEPYYVLPFMVALVTMPLFALMDLAESTSRAFGWVTMAYIVPYVLRPLLLLLGVGALELAGLVPDALSALVVMTLACLIGLGVQLAVLRPRIRRHVPPARRRVHARYWLAVSAPMLLFEGAYLLMASTDVMMLGRYVGPDEVAVYFAATRTASLIGFIYFAVSARAVPSFSEIHAAGDRAQLQRFLDGVNRMSFWPSLLGALALLAAGPFVLGLFGEGFARGYPVLAILAIGYVVRCTVGPLEYLLSMTGRQGVATRIICASTLANVALNAALIPYWGLEGAAAATVLAGALNLAALHRAVKRELGLSAFLLRPSR